MIETAPVSDAGFRATMAHFCTGLTVVTAWHDAQPVGFSCQAFASLSLDPAMVLLCPGKTSTTWPRIARAGRFTVNVLAAHQGEICRGFAVSGADKFAGLEWHRSSRTRAPVLDGVLAVVDCELEAQHEAGDHLIATARVLGLEHRYGEPLLYYQGEFHTVHRSAR
jgi:3-hydroxy-9,10-secoandrosta-1,3,5(10)-triene-9,17-dione monooxygenase reductase component